MFFQKRNVYPSNVWFTTVNAFKSFGLLRNKYFKISSNVPSSLLCNVWNYFFFIRFGSFSMFIEWYCIIRLFSSTLCSFFCYFLLRYWFLNRFLRGLIFGLILLLSGGKSLRLDIFGLKRGWNKRNSFLYSIRYPLLGR